MFNRLVLATCLPLLCVDCSSVQSTRNSSLDQAIASGDYMAAARLAEQRMGYKAAGTALPAVTYVPGHVLDHLDAAESWIMAGDAKRSLAHFDAAEQALKTTETQNKVASLGKTVGAVLTNDSVRDYVPGPAESVLMNYEKALTFWAQGDLANTRVELNRADDRTRLAVEHYRSELEKAKTASEQKNSAYAASDATSVSAAKQLPEMAQWKPYKEFVLPSATYLRALYLSRLGDKADADQALNLYKRVDGIVGPHAVIDAELREAGRGRVCPANDCVWIVVEHGLGPTLEERRLDLPIPTGSGVVVASIALPHLVSRTQSDAVPIGIRYAGKPVYAQMFSSMDRVVQTEFDKRWPAIVTRAVLAGSIKGVAQSQINSKLNQASNNELVNRLVNVAVGATSVAATSADVRMWRFMPSRWSLARVHKVSGSKLSLDTSSGPLDVDLSGSNQGSALVYIHAPNGANKPRVDVLKI